MSEDWDSYFARVNGAVSSIFIDLGIRATVPDASRPHILWIWVPMLHARDDGLSSDEESSTLYAIEDALTTLLSARNDAVLAGRITGSNRREYYFYGTHAHQFLESIAEVFAHFPAYMPEFGEQPDAEWNQYLSVLYPALRDLERIKTRRVITALADAGDSLVTPRTIRHWVYCRHNADALAISGDLAARGFAVSSAFSDEVTERPYGVSAEREAVAEQEVVDGAVFEILDVIEGRDAEYDGWESPVA